MITAHSHQLVSYLINERVHLVGQLNASFARHEKYHFNCLLAVEWPCGAPSRVGCAFTYKRRRTIQNIIQ
jgi:hypothetical protein